MARPRAKTVFPIPRSPCRRTTSPVRKRSASAAPWDRVSSSERWITRSTGMSDSDERALHERGLRHQVAVLPEQSGKGTHDDEPGALVDRPGAAVGDQPNLLQMTPAA